MHFKPTVMLIILSINCLYCETTESCTEDIDNTTQDLTDTYYRESEVKQKPCIPKCCPFGFAYKPKNKTCENTTEIFAPAVHDVYLRLLRDNASDLFYYKIGILQCASNESRMMISNIAQLKLGTDGNLYIEGRPDYPTVRDTIVTPDKYCIDNFIKKTTVVDALVCSLRKDDQKYDILSATCMLISCVFILITVSVYMLIPKLQNLHGRVLIVYLMCLFVGFLVMATMQMQLHYKVASNCTVIKFIIYFSLLSAFFWLNVMCYDIWRVFSGSQELRPQKLFIWSQLSKYALYAFGIPALLTILLAILKFADLPKKWYLPNIQDRECFLSGHIKLIYFYGPILTLCVANMILFFLTAVKIAKTQWQTSVLKSSESSKHDKQNRQTLFLYVKLFLLMGISWILEVISELYTSEYWRYTDAYNVLIGLVIFILFVCKPDIFRLLKERFARE